MCIVAIGVDSNDHKHVLGLAEAPHLADLGGVAQRSCRSSHIVLCSKRPDLVIQELYGLLLAHFAIRGLMHEAALEHKRDPDELSFTHAVKVIRRTLPTFNAFFP